MKATRRLSLVTCGTIAVFFAACHRGANRQDQPAGDTAVAETRTEPAREDPALTEQRRLAGELASLENRKASFAQPFAQQNKDVAQSERLIRDLKSTLEREKAETSQYIDQHEVQVACAFAREVARGEGEYSEKTRRCARIASVYCAIAMLSGTFRRKVAATRRYIDEAEIHAKSLRTRIVARTKELETQRAKLQMTKNEIDRTAFEISAVRHKLSGLTDGLQPVLPRGPGTSEAEMSGHP